MDFTPSPGFGRGRGLIYAAASDSQQAGQLGFGGHSSLDTAIKELELPTPITKPKSSTPATTDNDTLEKIHGLLGELGTQIGNSVVNRILANQTATAVRGPLPLLLPHH